MQNKSTRTVIALTLLTTFLIIQNTLLAQSVRSSTAHADELLQFEQLRKQAIRAADSLGIPIRIEADDFTVMELQRFVNGFPMYYITDNIIAAQSLSTDRIWPGGSAGFSLNGNTEILGMWDGGRARIEHQEFEGRAIQQDNASTNSSHATHVGATMIGAGVVPEAKGMSYTATLHAYDWNSDVTEMAQAAGNGLRVSNHSYGYITGWRWNYLNDNKWTWFGDTTVSQIQDYGYGFYDQSARSWDIVAWENPYYLPVKSAGNNRGSGPSNQPVEHWVWAGGTWILSTAIREIGGGEFGYDCIPYNGVAKNILTVGAVNDVPGGYNQPGDVVMSSFSSWGPTDDGRIKPDIVGNGVGLYSATANSNNSYSSYSGTSMSSPNVSGSIGLLLHNYRNIHGHDSIKAATMKALVIHTADEAGQHPGPDYIFGWGLMNTAKAAELMRQDSLRGLNFHIHELSLAQDQIVEIEIEAGTEPIRATIVWTDPPAFPVAPALNPPDLMLINDLDMRIANINDSIHQPYILDPANPQAAATFGDNFRDNVEMILISNSIPGSIYTISVTHKGLLENGVQDFSLIVSGNVPITYSCPPPMQLVASNISYNTALLEWTPGGAEEEWILEWGTAGFQPGNGIMLEGLMQPLWALSALAPGTAYDFYVKAFCDAEDISIWAGPKRFSTICDSVAVAVTIVADTNAFCGSHPVTFTASPVNGGNAPVFEWFVNGISTGSNEITFTYYPNFNDLVSCRIISSMICVSNNPAMSETIQMLAWPEPDVVWHSFAYDTVCYNWPALELTGGLPEGGIYSGPGVSNGFFDPVLAGQGNHLISYTFENEFSCVGHDSLFIFVDFCTYVTLIENLNQAFDVYPIPATNVLFIKNLNQVYKVEEIRIVDLVGQVILQEIPQQSGNTRQINLSHLAKGVYFLEIKTNSGLVVKKIILE